MNKYKQMNLPNGAKLYYVKNDISRTTMVDVAFNCGSRCDTIPGLAHFVEHMFFTGTKKYDKKAITKKYFDFINVNACTSNKKIYFNGNVFTKEFKDYLNTVAEMITNSLFSETMVKDECKVISQEIAMYKDNFQMNAYYFNDYNLTQDDLYKYANLGTNQTISTIKSKDVKNFVKKYFVQQNMEVYVSSPLSIAKVKKIIEQTLSTQIPTNNKFQVLPQFYYLPNNFNFHKIETQDIGKSYLFLNFVFKSDFADFKRRKKIELLTELLNNQSEGIMSDLRWGGNKNLTYGARFYVAYGKDNSVITFNTQCDKENINPIIETVASFVKRNLTNGFKQEILDFEKREYKYDDDAKEPNLRRKFGKLQDFAIFGEVRDDKTMRKYITETDLNECNNLFKEVFETPKLSMSVYGDATKKDVFSQTKINKMF